MRGGVRRPAWAGGDVGEARRLSFAEAEALGLRAVPWLAGLAPEAAGAESREEPEPGTGGVAPRTESAANSGGTPGEEASGGSPQAETRSEPGNGAEPPEAREEAGHEEPAPPSSEARPGAPEADGRDVADEAVVEPRPFRNTGRLQAIGSRPPTEPPPPLQTPPPGSASRLPPPSEVPPPPELPSAELAEALQQRIEAFAEAALELAAARARAIAQAEADLLELSVEVARAIVEEELRTAPELHARLARAALETLGEAEQVTLRASPAAYDAIVEAQGGAFLVVHGTRVEVRVDPSLQGLGCVVETGEARVDGRVEERLRAVRLAFEEERRRRHVEQEEEL